MKRKLLRTRLKSGNKLLYILDKVTFNFSPIQNINSCKIHIILFNINLYNCFR